MSSTTVKLSVVVVLMGVLAGCASSRTIPMKVQSDPLGAYVFMKHKEGGGSESDWVFLGNTPLTTQRQFEKDSLGKSDVFVLRLLKDGYLEQIKEWQGREIRGIGQDDQPLFWNPKLVPVN